VAVWTISEKPAHTHNTQSVLLEIAAHTNKQQSVYPEQIFEFSNQQAIQTTIINSFILQPLLHDNVDKQVTDPVSKSFIYHNHNLVTVY